MTYFGGARSTFPLHNNKTFFQSRRTWAIKGRRPGRGRSRKALRAQRSLMTDKRADREEESRRSRRRSKKTWALKEEKRHKPMNETQERGKDVRVGLERRTGAKRRSWRPLLHTGGAMTTLVHSQCPLLAADNMLLLSEPHVTQVGCQHMFGLQHTC